MGEGKVQVFQDQRFYHQIGTYVKNKDDGLINNEDPADSVHNYNTQTTSSSSSSFIEDSSISGGSSSSSDTADDASSSTSSSAGALDDFSVLMAQLPIKRGLSKFYQGKSESFTSLSRVTCIEDLPKKEVPSRRKMRGSKSYEAGLDAYRAYTLPRPVISKKASRGSFSSSFPFRKGSFINNSRPPLITVQKNL